MDRELLAAKVCGRWRTGVPLVLSPDTGTPDPPLANNSAFVRSVRGADGANPVRNISGQDVLLGVNDPATSSVTLSSPPTATASWSNRRLTGFGPFVTTRGGAH